MRRERGVADLLDRFVRRFRRRKSHVRNLNRVANRCDRAAHRNLRGIPLGRILIAAHADDDERGNLVRREQ
jgi:hypothetical protein